MERGFLLLTFLASFSLISWSQYCHYSPRDTSWQSTVFTFPLTPVSVSFWVLSSPHTLLPAVRILWKSALCAEAQGPCNHRVPAPTSENPVSAPHQPPKWPHPRCNDPKQNSSFHQGASPLQLAHFCHSSYHHSATLRSHSFIQQVFECPPCAKHWTRCWGHKMSKTKTGSLKDVSVRW